MRMSKDGAEGGDVGRCDGLEESAAVIEHLVDVDDERLDHFASEQRGRLVDEGAKRLGGALEPCKCGGLCIDKGSLAYACCLFCEDADEERLEGLEPRSAVALRVEVAHILGVGKDVVDGFESLLTILDLVAADLFECLLEGESHVGAADRDEAGEVDVARRKPCLV